MKYININYYKVAEAEFILGSFDEKLVLLDYKNRKNRDTIDNRLKKALKAEFINRSDAVLEQIKIELQEYFKGDRESFETPILPIGSDFQKSVWKALLKIEYGAIKSYKEIAKSIKNPKALRAVANANGANAIAIIIPCHRVIGSDGSLTGYAGGLDIKKRLLEIEKKDR